MNCLLVAGIGSAAANDRQQAQLSHHAQDRFHVHQLPGLALDPAPNPTDTIGLLARRLARNDQIDQPLIPGYAFIDRETVARCVAAVQAVRDIHLSLHTPGHGYAFNFPATPSLLQGWGIQAENLRPLSKATMAETAKMLIFRKELVGETEPLPASLGETLQTICAGKARLYITDHEATMQLTSLEAGKLAAIRSIQGQLGLQDNEIAVFGDDLNDLEMLSAYPVSIAMGNAVPQVKECAQYVTRANDEDGIAWAIDRILHLL